MRNNKMPFYLFCKRSGLFVSWSGYNIDAANADIFF
jgi:hypothetical protein